MTILETGNWLNQQLRRGALIEYTLTEPPLALYFAFNPTTITRTRSISVKTGGAAGTQGGYDFQSPQEIVRASQGVTVNAESLSVKILLDATDRLNAGDPQAQRDGIQPEIDTLRCMVEPKLQTPQGARTLAALGEGSMRAFTRQQFASVLLFRWGVHVFPVFMTEAQVEIKEYLPGLVPYRAEAALALQVIESNNPFYREELRRQFNLANQYAAAARSTGGLGV